MIEEMGVVVSVQGAIAEVQAERRSACGSCIVNGACGTSLLDRYFGRKRSLLKARNLISAAPGDHVIIGIPENALLAASFVAYLVPLLAMIAGAMAGVYIAGLIVPAYEQALSVVTGLGGFVAALAWLLRFGRAKSSDESYRPQILRSAGRVGEGRAVKFQTPGLSETHYS